MLKSPQLYDGIPVTQLGFRMSGRWSACDRVVNGQGDGTDHYFGCRFARVSKRHVHMEADDTEPIDLCSKKSEHRKCEGRNHKELFSKNVPD